MPDNKTKLLKIFSEILPNQEFRLDKPKHYKNNSEIVSAIYYFNHERPKPDDKQRIKAILFDRSCVYLKRYVLGADITGQGYV